MLRLRFADFSRATRSHTLAHATAQTQVVLAVARSLLSAAQSSIEVRGLTLIGVAITNLGPDLPRQLALPLEAEDREVLDGILDEIRDRFGSAAITRAVLLGRPAGLAIPLLPGRRRARRERALMGLA